MDYKDIKVLLQEIGFPTANFKREDLNNLLQKERASLVGFYKTVEDESDGVSHRTFYIAEIQKNRNVLNISFSYTGEGEDRESWNIRLKDQKGFGYSIKHISHYNKQYDTTRDRVHTTQERYDSGYKNRNFLQEGTVQLILHFMDPKAKHVHKGLNVTNVNAVLNLVANFHSEKADLLTSSKDRKSKLRLDSQALLNKTHARI